MARSSDSSMEQLQIEGRPDKGSTNCCGTLKKKMCWGLLFWLILALSLGLGCYLFYKNETSSPYSECDTQPNARSVAFVWSGGVTATGAVVKAIFVDSSDVPVFTFNIKTTSDNVVRSAPTATILADGVRQWSFVGLDANTDYTYTLVVGTETMTGRFKTFPAEGSSAASYSFRFAFASCAGTGSDHPVFSSIQLRAAEPKGLAFMLHMGDLHYSDIDVNSTALFQQAYKKVLAPKMYYCQENTERQAQLFRRVPIALSWDDHDYGANNAGADNPAKIAAKQAYREYVPHYPISGSSTQGIQQTWWVGRTKFIATDLRWDKSDKDANKRVAMSPDQLSWFLNELTTDRLRQNLVVWLSSIPFVGKDECGGDTWGAFWEQRNEIGKYVADNDVKMVVVGGDMHGSGWDDGTNSNYAPAGQFAGMHVFQAAALDKTGFDIKGGPYSSGITLGRGMYAVMEVNDGGMGDVKIKVTWRQVDRDGNVEVIYQTPEISEFIKTSGSPSRAGEECGSIGLKWYQKWALYCFALWAGAGVLIFGVLYCCHRRTP